MPFLAVGFIFLPFHLIHSLFLFHLEFISLARSLFLGALKQSKLICWRKLCSLRSQYNGRVWKTMSQTHSSTKLRPILNVGAYFKVTNISRNSIRRVHVNSVCLYTVKAAKYHPSSVRVKHTLNNYTVHAFPVTTFSAGYPPGVSLCTTQGWTRKQMLYLALSVQ